MMRIEMMMKTKVKIDYYKADEVKHEVDSRGEVIHVGLSNS